MAKRSPILGYNHNVRYRGLVFHVQTEDSGVMSPHLFTHLFHEGVIISSRKLVYDGSASEEAIKALMQSQHKAVLRDLKIHTFDDKIDVYLANVEGLEPREVAAPAPAPRVSDPEITIEPGEPVEPVEPTVDRAGTDPGEPPVEAIQPTPPLPPQSPKDVAAKPRTQTADRTSKSSQFRTMAPPDADSTLPAGSNLGLRPPAPVAPRSVTPPPIPGRTATSGNQSRTAIPLSTDSSPEIEIIKDDASESNRMRTPRDTAVDSPYEDGIPGMIGPDHTIPSDGIPPRPVEHSPSTRMANPSRPPSHNAATLPAVRQPSRPAVTPPSVVSRPLPPGERNRGDSEAIEIYAPAPPSVEPPPGERSERPGQYSMNRKASQENVPLRELTGRVAVPAGLTPPRRAQTQAHTSQSGSIRTNAPSTPPIPSVPNQQARAPQSDGIPRAPSQAGAPASDGVPQMEGRAQTPTQSPRTPHLTAPISSRTATGSAPSSGAHASGNVVMTRPAVIVGAPAKAPGTPVPKVRKAREDEGRGFGQGLISEKSLDEVILAYLSEDADEK